MINTLDIEATPAPLNTLLIDSGANLVERREVYCTPTPASTETHFPMPHSHLIEEVEAQLWHMGFNIRAHTHALSHGGARYFGLIEVYKQGQEKDDYIHAIAVRNSHDKSIPAGIAAGSKVLICSNLALNAEIKIQRKHTKFAQRDLRDMTKAAISQLDNKLRGIDQRIDHYKSRRVSDLQAHDLIIKAVDAKAITNSQIPEVIEQWRKPNHECFKQRTAWSLFNAFTEATKKVNPHTQVHRGTALQTVFDSKYPLC